MQGGVHAFRCHFSDCQAEAVAYRRLVASAKETVANLGQFVFWNARTKVLDCNGYYALPTPQITADGSVGQRMQDCIFK